MGKRTIASVGENALLKTFRKRLPEVGDDAALLKAIGPTAVLSTDLLVEDVDFERRWATPTDIGHKAAAVNISDLAAMGARPRALLLTLGLRGSDSVQDVLRLVSAVHRTGRRFGAPLCGGDLSATSGPLVVGVTAVGEVERRRALRRHCGQDGDQILVSGALGGARAGLWLLQQGRKGPKALVRRQLRPEPQVALGRALGRSGLVRSGADISDGLARDALHVAGPGCTVLLDVSLLPLARGLAAVAQAQGTDAWEQALAGGEDFELVLAVAPKRVERAQAVARRVGVRLTAVGRVVRGRRPVLLGAGGRALPAGFDHFRA